MSARLNKSSPVENTKLAPEILFTLFFLDVVHQHIQVFMTRYRSNHSRVHVVFHLVGYPCIS